MKNVSLSTVGGMVKFATTRSGKPLSLTTRVREEPVKPAAEALITPGVHLLHARVCSMRGVCGIFDAAVTVIPVDAATPSAASAPDSSAQHQSPISLIRLLLELVLAIARKLITP